MDRSSHPRPSRIRTPRTIGRTLVLLVLAVLVPAFALEARSYTTQLARRRDAELGAGLEMARATAVAFEAFLHDIIGDLQRIATVLRVSAPPSPREIQRLLSETASEYPALLELSWLDTDGRVLATTAPGLAATWPRPRPWIHEIVAGRDFAVTNLVAAPPDQEPVFSIALGVRGGDRRVHGVLVAVIAAERLGWATLPFDRGGGGSITVMDRKGQLVSQRPEIPLTWEQRDLLGGPEQRGDPLLAMALSGQEATGETVARTDGKAQLAAAVPIPRVGWVAGASRPVDEALAPERRLILMHALWAGVLLASGVALATTLGRRIVGPVRWLEKRATAFGSGSRAPGKFSTHLRELGALAAAFDRMEDEIAARERSLDAARREATSAAERARAEAARLDSTFESAPDGIVLHGTDGEVLRMNAAASRLYRTVGWRSAGSLAAQLGESRLSDAEGAALDAAESPVARALRGEVVRSSALLVTPPDGAVPPVALSVSTAPVRGPLGEVIGAVATFVDISPVRALQEQREDLLRVVSHDLRSPLGAIMGQARLAQRRTGEDPSWYASRASAILVAAGRMNAMIEDLLDSTRFEAGQLRLALEPIDPSVFVPDLLARLGTSLEAGRIVLDLQIPPGTVVLADPNRLERVLVNLLSNALKYSPPRSPVRLAVAPRDGSVSFAVTDEGPGIPVEDQPHLFERFFRGRKTAAGVGVGLGLYSARVLVEAHGGVILVDSRPGTGTTFRVRLPAAPPS